MITAPKLDFPGCKPSIHSNDHQKISSDFKGNNEGNASAEQAHVRWDPVTVHRHRHSRSHREILLQFNKFGAPCLSVMLVILATLDSARAFSSPSLQIPTQLNRGIAASNCQNVHHRSQHFSNSLHQLNHPRSCFISTNPSLFRSTATSITSLPSSASANAASAICSSLHGNTSFILSTLLVVSACGIAMEQKTTFGKALSAPLVTMLISLILANVGIIPFSSSVYGLINKVLVPLAVPLFLFDSDLQRVIRDAGSLLLAFCVGAFSTVVGTICAFALIPLKALGGSVAGSVGEGWKVACALAARHIGGAINFVAVADTLNIDGGIVSAAIAADNVVVAIYFAFLFFLSTSGESGKTNPSTQSTTTANTESTLSEEIVLPDDEAPPPITTSSITYSIATASILATLGELLTKSLCPTLSPLVLTSLLTVISATIYPKWFQTLRTTGTAIGILFLQLFFAASGAAGSLLLVLRRAPSLIEFSALQLAIHFLVLIGLGRVVFRMDLNELYLASNANVGGPTTAAAMAQAKEWPRLVLPALLVGVLGYATATAVSLSLGPFLIRLAARGG